MRKAKATNVVSSRVSMTQEKPKLLMKPPSTIIPITMPIPAITARLKRRMSA